MKFKFLKESKFKFYTDGQKTIKIKDGDEIPDGFHPGRTFKSNPFFIKMLFINGQIWMLEKLNVQ